MKSNISIASIGSDLRKAHNTSQRFAHLMYVVTPRDHGLLGQHPTTSHFMSQNELLIVPPQKLRVVKISGYVRGDSARYEYFVSSTGHGQEKNEMYLPLISRLYHSEEEAMAGIDRHIVVVAKKR